MLRLYTLWELEREVTPEEFQHILTPETALEKATYCYDLDYRNALLPPFSEVPRRLSTRKDKPYKRADRSLYDPVYDALEMNLLEGWIIGLDSNEPWDNAVNPFHINIDGELVFECADPFCWVISEFQRAYQLAINNQNGKKPAPTEKFRPSGEPLQHAQAAKTINSKAAGRLLAAGGIYNGNIEGFRKTAEQLGGDAPAGYAQVMDNKGLIIAGASIAAGLMMGRSGTAMKLSGPEKLHVLGKVEGEYSLINPGPLSERFAETFSGGVYKEIILSEDTVFYRGGQNGIELGRFFSYEKPQGIIQTRIDKAVRPEWPDGSKSVIDRYFEVKIPANTKVYVGEVGYQTDLYSGGSEQVLIPAPWNIPGVKILDFGELK